MWTGVYVLLAVAMCGIVRAELSDAELLDAVIGTSIDMFKAATAGQLRNQMVSPVSSSILLALMDHGAKGITSQQLQIALRLNHQQVREAYRKLSQNLRADTKPSQDKTSPEAGDAQLEMATRVFVNEGVPLLEEFQQTAATDFFTEVDKVPFGSVNSSHGINLWTYHATRGEIASIVDSALPAETSMVLANAMYFKSAWSSPFETQNTVNGTFTVSPGLKLTVSYMHQETSTTTGANDNLGVKWVQIPFKGGKYSLLVVLPNKKFGLADVLADMTSSDFKEMLNEGDTKAVSLFLPRVSLSSSNKLVPALKTLGITDLFTESSNLSKISSQTSLRVSDFFQKMKMELDEGQAINSATTGNKIVKRDAAEEFRVDHPFVAVVVKSGRIPVFMGTIVDPTAV